MSARMQFAKRLILPSSKSVFPDPIPCIASSYGQPTGQVCFALGGEECAVCTQAKQNNLM